MTASETASVVCGVDRSPGALAAARFAAILADRLGLRLVLVHALEPPPIPLRDVGGLEPWYDFATFEHFRDAGAALLDEVKDDLSLGDDAMTVVRVGGPTDVIAALAEEMPIEFVVVGSRGLGSVRRVVLGSVSFRLAGQGPCPTVIVPEGDHTFAGTSIVCAVDDSEHALSAVEKGALLAQRLHLDLLLAHVEPDDAASSARGRELLARIAFASGLGTSVERILLHGEPADALVASAHDHAALMTVIGSRGRGPVAASLLGSVSSAVVERSTCPVAVFRAQPAA